MWLCLKSDFSYYRKTIFWILIILILISLYEIWLSNTGREQEKIFRSLPLEYFKFWLLFIVPKRWNLYHNTERRNFKLAGLPLSINSLALLRILAVGIPTVFCLAFNALILEVAQKAALIDFQSDLLILGAELSFFSVYYLGRDFRLTWLRKRGLNRQQVILILVLLVLTLNLLTLALFTGVRANNKPAIAVGQFFDWLFANLPFSGANGGLELFICGVILSGLSWCSFKFRKSYLE